MTVLIYEQTSSGKRRQCNSRCHSAKLSSCACICGGRFHGGAVIGDPDSSAKISEFYREILREAEERGSKITMQLPLNKEAEL